MNSAAKYDLVDVATTVIVNVADGDVAPLSWAGAVSLQTTYEELTGQQACIKAHGTVQAAHQVNRFDLLLVNSAVTVPAL